MIDKPRQDSSRDLLEELEDGWTPNAPALGSAGSPRASEDEHVKAKVPSTPDIDAVDSGWLDDLFPGEDEDEDEEEDEPEPELPDERLDPVAYAAAKQARDERAAKKKEKKKAKADAKRARQKARANAQRQRQKPKKARAGGARTGPASSPSPLSQDDESGHAEAASEGDEAPPATAKARGTGPVARRANTLQSVKLLVVVLAVLLALAAVVAAIVK